MYKTILLDLDGTLTDPGIGITNSVMYALDKYGIKVADRRELYSFIGPPLIDSFTGIYGFDREKGEQAVAYYREYFSVTGLFENELYDGIPELLSDLKSRGFKLVLATSKPDVYAVRILEHFGLDKYFDHIAAATLDGHINHKDEVIALALTLSGAEKSDAVMIGDRKYDILGANAHGLASIGVTYGYGSREELCEAGATYVVGSVEELRRLLIK